MPVIAVINRKGGSGKSTLATHLAAYCAHQGLPALLGDADFQQSSHAWLRRRDRQRLAVVPKIVGWTVDPKNVLRAPSGVTHIVLDTPGGLKGYELLRVVMLADAVLMPVCYSMFDRESAAECLAELQVHPRVARGRCRVAAVGMRLDARTKAEESLRGWADDLGLPFLGAVRETQTYVKCLEHGLTIFDMPAAKVEADLAQWQPILRWLAPQLQPAAANEPGATTTAVAETAIATPAAAATARAPAETASAKTASFKATLPRPTLSRTAASKTALPKSTRPVLPPGSSPSGALKKPLSNAEQLEAAERGATAAGELGPPVLPTPIAPALPGSPALAARAAAAAAPEAPVTTRPASLDELDSRFGFSTRIGRWLEMLSMRRAR